MTLGLYSTYVPRLAHQHLRFGHATSRSNNTSLPSIVEPPSTMGETTRLEELEKRLQQAEEYARQERQRAEDAERARLEERQRAEDAERARLEERQRAEAERQRAEAERQRAEEERQRAEASEKQTRPTTIDEYIAACHSLVYSKLTVERDRRLTSKGPITSPRHKWCPTNLKPWPDFLEHQRLTLGALYETFPSEMRAFETRNFLDGLGQRIARRSIADEKTLEYFLHNSVEDPVRTIVDQLKEVEAVRDIFNLGRGIIFENHPHAISETSEEVLQQGTPSTPPSTPGHTYNLNQLRADQICVYRSDGTDSTRRTMLFISEYKPPHKLTAPHLRLGLRPINIYNDVVNRKTIPTSVDPDARFQYQADRLTASALTQTYHYMIEGGLEYGLLTTAEMIVFLKINWQEPGTLLYHLAEPAAEVLAHPEHLLLCTAVGQYLAFSLMAVGAPDEQHMHSQDERHRATAELKTWLEDFETTLRSIPEDERWAPQSSPAYEPVTYEGVDRSPYIFRRRRQQSSRDEPDQRLPGAREDQSSDSDEAPDTTGTPSPAERQLRRGERGRQGDEGSRRSERILARRPRTGNEGKEGMENRAYCSHKCLRGLVVGETVDLGCPNMALHKMQDVKDVEDAEGMCHSISHAKFLSLLSEQLERTLDHGIQPLKQGGARGVLFKVTLLAYGYTFVSKGTVQAFVKDFKHEAAVYQRLSTLQGRDIPVFLGTIDLHSISRTYYFDHRVYVVYMAFLSWGGTELNAMAATNRLTEATERKVIQSLRMIHKLGVIHADMRAANILYDSRTGNLMVIDFERAVLLESPRVPLGQLVPNKRRWKVESQEHNELVPKRRGGVEERKTFLEDVRFAKAIFGRCKV